MILTFQTDILTFQTNFLLSDYFVRGLEFRGQKVWFFPLTPRGPPQTNIIITQKWLNSRIPEKNSKLLISSEYCAGHTKYLRGPIVARGPRVRHPWFRRRVSHEAPMTVLSRSPARVPKCEAQRSFARSKLRSPWSVTTFANHLLGQHVSLVYYYSFQ